MTEFRIIVKVGGSLFDMPDLGARVEAWVRALGRRDILLTVGGGPAADVIREMDRVHRIGEEASHNLAVESLTLMTSVFLSLAPPSLLLFRLGSPEPPAERAGGRQSYPVLDLGHFAWGDADQPGSLPRCWDVTSDSLAARAAEVFRSRELILLKSVTIPPDMDWAEASRRGYVDPYFPRMATRRVKARAVNLREWRP